MAAMHGPEAWVGGTDVMKRKSMLENIYIRRTEMDRFMQTGWKSLLVALIIVACQTGSANSAAAETTPGQCEIALMQVIDVSKSMGTNVAPGQSMLEVLKRINIRLVQDLPTGHWNMGLATFPDPAPLKWGLQVLTDWSRPSLIAALNRLSAGGSASLDAALTFAGLALATDMQRPRFLIIFFDGGVCSAVDDALLDMAAYLRDSLGIFIIVVGYNLGEEDATAMHHIASLQPDGIPAFYSTQTVSDANACWDTTLRTLCSRLQADITTDSPTYLTGRRANPGGLGGSAQVVYRVQYLQGRAHTVKVLATGSFLDAGGSIVLDPLAHPLSAASPLFEFPLRIETAEAPAGDYDLMLYVVPAEGGAALAARTVRISVVPIAFTARFEPGYPFYHRASQKIGTRFHVLADLPAAISLPRLTIRIFYRVTQAATGMEGQGFDLPQTQEMPWELASGPLTQAIDIPIGRGTAAEGTYNVHVALTILELGVEREIVGQVQVN
jgi:hypothetical protein